MLLKFIKSRCLNFQYSIIKFDYELLVVRETNNSLHRFTSSTNPHVMDTSKARSMEKCPILSILFRCDCCSNLFTNFYIKCFQTSTFFTAFQHLGYFRFILKLAILSCFVYLIPTQILQFLFEFSSTLQYMIHNTTFIFATTSLFNYISNLKLCKMSNISLLQILVQIQIFLNNT
jgi:hypothetical protein